MRATRPLARDPNADAPTRIAMVITRSDAVGGAQIHVYELTRALIAAGHHLCVFVGGEGPFVDMLRAAEIPVAVLPSLQREIHPLKDLRSILELLRALRDFGPDLVSTHSTKAGWFGRMCARVLGVPVVVTAHGSMLTPGKLDAGQRVAQFAEWSLAPLARCIIAVSQYDRAIALEHGIASARRIRVVHNALPPIDESLQADPSAHPPRILAVARLDEPKDPVCLVEALAQLRELDWSCELIGDGKLRGVTEAAIERSGLRERIDMLGTRDDVPQRLAGAQIFVLPTKREGFPISILEAMRAGMPTVAADVGGISEAIIPGETGELVTASDPNSLAAALRRLVSDPSLRAQQGAQGRARFEREFAFETHLHLIWALYHAVMVGSDLGPD